MVIWPTMFRSIVRLPKEQYRQKNSAISLIVSKNSITNLIRSARRYVLRGTLVTL